MGRSSLRAVELTTGKVLQQVNVPKDILLKGGPVWDKLYQLTWTSQKGFIYDAKTFASWGVQHPAKAGVTTMGVG